MRKFALVLFIASIVLALTACSGLTVKATYQYPPAEDRK